MIRLKYLLCMILITFSLSACNGDNKQTFEEKLWQSYSDTGRIDKYNDLVDRYGDKRVILWLNKDEDSWWITNFSLWLIFSILPDIPDIMATGVIGVFFYVAALCLGVTLTGGGILAVLAWLGKLLPGIPIIPLAIVGIIFLGIMFSVLVNIFRLIF